MRRTLFVCALICALFTVSSVASVAAPASADDCDPTKAVCRAVAFRPDTPALAPLDATRDLGEPTDIDPAVLEAIGKVHTDPGSIPQLQVTVDGKKQALPLEHTDVRASISGFVARVEVTQRYKNPMDRPIEAIYVFPLPENSAVDDMKIRVGDRLIEAEIQRREQARQTYETAKRDGFTAALLEQERPNVFTQSVANIPPGEEIDVVIRYVQDLTYDAGEYEFVFPMVVGPRFVPGAPTGKTGPGWSPDTDEVPDASRITPPVVGGGHRSGHDIAIEVVIEPGLPVVDFDVPTHAADAVVADEATVITLSPKDSLPNRDFILRFRVDKPETQGAVYAHKSKHGGFFTLVVQPPTVDVEELVGQREIIFVVDISGSMWGKPIEMAKEAAREAIRRLRPVDTFNVVTFAGQTAKAFDAPRPANTTNIKEGLAFLEAARAGGGTYLANAVQQVLDPAVDGERDRIVVFLTDGYVGNEKRIVADVRRFVGAHSKAGHRSRAFGFGVGSSVNRYLIDGIGKAGNGSGVYLTTREDPIHAVDTMSRLIDHPIITDVTIDWDGLDVKDVEPTVMPDLLASRPLVLHGRYGNGGTGTIVLKGKADGRRVRVEVPVVLPEDEPRAAVLETLWARARIETLSRVLWDGDDKETIETITALGLDYRLVTPYTSFVAVDRSRKVGDGDPTTIVQPVDAPEGVTPEMAAPASGVLSGKMMKTAQRTRGLSSVLAGGDAGSAGFGGLGLMGSGAGGGGGVAIGSRSGHGRAGGTGKMGTRSPAAPSPAPAVALPIRLAEDADESGVEVGFAREERVDATKTDAAKKEAAGERRSSDRGGPAKLRALTKLAAVSVEGALEKAVVRRVVARVQSQLKYCYELQLKTHPKLAGAVTFEWTIGKDGRVSGTSIVANTTGSADLGACIEGKVKRWRFPAAEKKTTARWKALFRVE